MKNNFIEKIVEDIAAGNEVTKADRTIAKAYIGRQYMDFGQLCFSDPIQSAEEAVGLVQKLSMYGVNEVFITGEWSNQLGAWLDMDCFGMKLRGIVALDNADYLQDLRRWGISDREQKIPALRFSFVEVE